jgi:hypothetical protein
MIIRTLEELDEFINERYEVSKQSEVDNFISGSYDYLFEESDNPLHKHFAGRYRYYDYVENYHSYYNFYSILFFQELEIQLYLSEIPYDETKLPKEEILEHLEDNYSCHIRETSGGDYEILMYSAIYLQLGVKIPPALYIFLYDTFYTKLETLPNRDTFNEFVTFVFIYFLNHDENFVKAIKYAWKLYKIYGKEFKDNVWNNDAGKFISQYL